MTADKYLTYWCSNDEWWDYDENGKPVVLPNAPREAQESYSTYISMVSKAKLIDVFEYEDQIVFVRCVDGREYGGHVKWCARADDVDEVADVMNIDGIAVLANEIEIVSIIG